MDMYKATSDINNNADPAAVAGVDNDQAVSPMVNSNPESSTLNFALEENVQTNVTENESAVIKLVVIDGIVMGPQHCAFGDCTTDLAILEVEFSAQFMRFNMEQNTESLVVFLQK